MNSGRVNAAAETDRGRRERRGDSLLKVADEVALQAAEETLRVRRRHARLLAAVFVVRAQDARGGRLRAGPQVAVEVRGGDEEGVPDEEEQHEPGRRGRLDKAGAGGAFLLRQVSASEWEFSGRIYHSRRPHKSGDAAISIARGAEPGTLCARNILTNGRTTKVSGIERLRVDTSLRAPIECRSCWHWSRLPYLPEKMVVSLIKAIVIIVALILSLLLFGRFFS